MTLQRNTPLKSDANKARAGRERAAKRYRDRVAQEARDLLKAGVSLPAMARVSRRRMELDGPRLRRSGSTMRQNGHGFSASAEQQAKTRAANAYPITKPDSTKLVRAVEDALTGVLWGDDAQVVDQHVFKRYGVPERAEIEVRSMDRTVGSVKMAEIEVAA